MSSEKFAKALAEWVLSKSIFPKANEVLVIQIMYQNDFYALAVKQRM